jgi:hypothetical protein
MLSDTAWMRWLFLFNASMDVADLLAVLLAVKEKLALKITFYSSVAPLLVELGR